MKFAFTMDKNKRNGTGKYYITNMLNSKQIDMSTEEDMVFWGTYSTYFKGPHTAFASFNIQFRWEEDSNSWFGFKLNKYITGYNSGQAARRWLNLMLRNSPNYILFTTGRGDSPDVINSFLKDLHNS